MNNDSVMDLPSGTASRWDKRLAFGIIGVAAIALTFWTSSRYPALDEKASLGGDNDISALAFDQIVEVSASDSILWKVTGNALNWAYTNKQGMFFGILFAAAIMCLLQLLAQKQFKGRFANTLLGVSIGAPLGVCVNCAVPIAMGVNKSGARAETTLAVLMSSPSLNLVVLSMTFAMFPFWLASLKVGVTLAFIILAIPLAVRLFGPEGDISQNDLDDVLDKTPSLEVGQNPSEHIYSRHEPMARLHWGSALLWYVRTYAANLWYIFKITVPLMILAGILGSIVVTFLPWETLAALVPATGLAWVLGIFLVAALGTFFPVPIAFDVVICVVLLAAGVDPTYVAVLLLTLGLFSIYPALQIGASMSRKLAIGLFAMVTLTGVGTGFLANALDDLEMRRQAEAIGAGLSRPLVNAPSDASETAQSTTVFLERLQDKALPPGEIQSLETGLEIESWGFQSGFSVYDKNGSLFKLIYGPEMGVDLPDDLSPLKFLEPIARTRSISSGDIHGDGWPDLMVTSDEGLFIFANLQGEGFERQPVNISNPDPEKIHRVLLADVDGDEDLDLIAGTYWDGVYILKNEGGDFTKAAEKLPGHVEDSILSALAVGDLDQDGQLDIVIGNSAIGNNLTNRSSTVSQNLILKRVDGVWTADPLQGPEGETLTILIADLNRDARPDLMIGNDYQPPDHLYLSNKAGELKRMPRNFIKGGTTRWTMSLATGDIDGDLVPEVYAGNISGRAEAEPRNAEIECRYETGSYRENCEMQLDEFTPIRKARQQADATGCSSFEDNTFAQGCAIVAMTQGIMRRGGSGPDVVGDICDKIPENWPDFKRMCETRKAEGLTRLNQAEKARTLASRRKDNVLLKRNSDGSFENIAEMVGVENGGWTWNARFADLDNDADLDLYVVNGHGVAVNRYDDRFFENSDGTFTDKADSVGLGSGVPSLAYSYVDFDRDGDLDIVTLPLTGPAKIFVNKAAQSDANSISFELRDNASNSYAYGAEVIIRYEGGAQIRELQMSGGFSSFDNPHVHFGLGDVEEVESVDILWPDGQRSVIETPLKAGAHYRIRRN